MHRCEHHEWTHRCLCGIGHDHSQAEFFEWKAAHADG